MASKSEIPREVVTAIVQSSERLEGAASILAMLELVRPTAPYIFADAGPNCVRGACTEGKMTCGKPYERVKRD